MCVLNRRWTHRMKIIMNGCEWKVGHFGEGEEGCHNLYTDSIT